MKAVVAAFNQEKALVGAFSVITNLRMQLFEALISSCQARVRVLGGEDKWPGRTIRRTCLPTQGVAVATVGRRLVGHVDCVRNGD